MPADICELISGLGDRLLAVEVTLVIDAAGDDSVVVGDAVDEVVDELVDSASNIILADSTSSDEEPSAF